VNPTPVVLKFGSSVLTNRDCLPQVVHHIYRYYRCGQPVLAVVSAIGRHTDLLLDAASYWMATPAPDSAVAELLATGEQQSAALLTMALHRAGIVAALLSPFTIKLTLSGERLDASPTFVDVAAIRRAFETSPVLVLPGFSGMHEEGGTALMGRGGSDLTAVFLAGCLGVRTCDLVKDVDGIYERDPAADAVTSAERRRPHRFGGVTYDEALRVSGELVQPKTLEYLRAHKFEARVTGLLLDDGTDIGTVSTSVHDRPAATPLRVLLMGLGQVGQGVYQHLLQLRQFFEITGIQVRDTHKKRNVDLPSALLTTRVEELMARPHDLVVDVSGDPLAAYTVIGACLEAGRPAVTASKRLVADRGPELTRLAGRSSVRFCYSAAVGGGTPMIETLSRASQHGRVTRLRGVLNGTCNYVLDRMAQGIPMHTAVSEARMHGFAESNVSRDLHGDDSADKLRILARLAFGAESDAIPISCHGMPPAGAGQSGTGTWASRIVRQVATFDPENGASVKLEALPVDDYLAGARGEENRLAISSADGQEWRIGGKGAGRWPTAEAVVADLIDIHAQVTAAVDGYASRLVRYSVPPQHENARSSENACDPVSHDGAGRCPPLGRS
jgi:homoserine dehydrogenase